jgi:hypothetical protein
LVFVDINEKTKDCGSTMPEFEISTARAEDQDVRKKSPAPAVAGPASTERVLASNGNSNGLNYSNPNSPDELIPVGDPLTLTDPGAHATSSSPSESVADSAHDGDGVGDNADANGGNNYIASSIISHTDSRGQSGARITDTSSRSRERDNNDSTAATSIVRTQPQVTNSTEQIGAQWQNRLNDVAYTQPPSREAERSTEIGAHEISTDQAGMNHNVPANTITNSSGGLRRRGGAGGGRQVTSRTSRALEAERSMRGRSRSVEVEREKIAERVWRERKRHGGKVVVHGGKIVQVGSTNDVSGSTNVLPVMYGSPNQVVAPRADTLSGRHRAANNVNESDKLLGGHEIADDSYNINPPHASSSRVPSRGNANNRFKTDKSERTEKFERYLQERQKLLQERQLQQKMQQQMLQQQIRQEKIDGVSTFGSGLTMGTALPMSQGVGAGSGGGGVVSPTTDFTGAVAEQKVTMSATEGNGSTSMVNHNVNDYANNNMNSAGIMIGGHPDRTTSASESDARLLLEPSDTSNRLVDSAQISNSVVADFNGVSADLNVEHASRTRDAVAADANSIDHIDDTFLSTAREPPENFDLQQSNRASKKEYPEQYPPTFGHESSEHPTAVKHPNWLFFYACFLCFTLGSTFFGWANLQASLKKNGMLEHLCSNGALNDPADVDNAAAAAAASSPTDAPTTGDSNANNANTVSTHTAPKTSNNLPGSYPGSPECGAKQDLFLGQIFSVGFAIATAAATAGGPLMDVLGPKVMVSWGENKFHSLGTKVMVSWGENIAV